MPYREHAYIFQPLLYAEPYDRGDLTALFSGSGILPTFELKALRRRHAWATTLPPGVWDNDFRAGIATTPDASYARVIASAAAGHHRRVRAFPARYEPVVTALHTFHHVEAIRVLRDYVTRPAFLNALYVFLVEAVRRPSLIIPPRPPAPFVPFEERRARQGRVYRGPAWTEQENMILRRWFGMHTVGPHAGEHVPLTEEQWATVLAALGGRRTRAGIKEHISDLNRRTLRDFLVAGYVPRDRVRAYMARMLGERPRLPPMAPKGMRLRERRRA